MNSRNKSIYKYKQNPNIIFIMTDICNSCKGGEDCANCAPVSAENNDTTVFTDTEREPAVSENASDAAVKVSDIPSTFMQELEGLVDLFRLRYPDCEVTKRVYAHITEIDADETLRESLLALWYIKLQDHFDECAERDSKIISSISTLNILRGMDFAKKFAGLGEEDRDSVWIFLDNLNNLCTLYKESDVDTGFHELVSVAQRVMVAIPRNELRQGSSIIQHLTRTLPTIVQDEEACAFLNKLTMCDQRMGKVMSLLEFHFQTKLDDGKRGIACTMLRAAASGASTPAGRQIITGIAGLAEGATQLLQSFSTGAGNASGNNGFGGLLGNIAGFVQNTFASGAQGAAGNLTGQEETPSIEELERLVNEM